MQRTVGGGAPVITASRTYDMLGNALTFTDGNSNLYRHSYADSFSAGAPPAGLTTYAFPTTITYPLVPSSSTAFQATVQYDYYLGRPTAYTGLDNIPSSFTYDTAVNHMDRPTQVIVGTSPQTQKTFTYCDVGSSIPCHTENSITTTSDLNTSGDNVLKTKVMYDALGRDTETRTYENATANGYIVVQKQRDALGRVNKVSNPFRPGDTVYWTTTQFDGLSRVTSVTTPAPNGASTTTSYQGNTTTVQDPAVNKRTSITDALGRLTQVTEDPGGLGYNTFYNYDALDDLTRVCQNGANDSACTGGQKRTFTYDLVKRLQFATNPEYGSNGQIGYTYDANGNVKTRTDPRSVTTTYNYDALNRVSLKSYAGTPAAPNVTYCYDGQIAGSQDGVCVAPSSAIPNSRGRLTQMRSSASTTTHGSYDGLGRVTQSSQFTGTTTYPFSYAYNAAGLLTSLVYPSGRTVTTGYDMAGRSNQLGLGAVATQYVSSVSYLPHGAINQLTFGSGGVQETTTYDPQRLQPTNISGVSSSSTLLTLGYGWCPASDCTRNNGNLQSQTITVGASVMTQSYGYDKLNRLSSAAETAPSQPGWNQAYTYDAYGNRAVGGNWIPNGVQTPQALTDYLDNTGASPAPNTNRWKAWTPNFTNGNVYDVAGNLQKVTNGFACNSPAPCPQYGYDAENRMVSATSLQNTPDTTYVYDGDGRRVQKVQSSGATTYVYDATGNLAAEYGTPTDHGTKFLLTDHLGSTRVLVASDGTSPKRYDYLPSGEEIPASTDGRGPEYSAGVYPSPAGPQSLEFTGKERDAETGLDYFEARYFSSPQGRFTSPDPYNIIAEAENREQFNAYISQPQNWNRYSYVWNNPLRHVDPTGETVYVIAYTYSNEAGDEEIKRAAQTRANEIRNSKGFDPNKDTVLVAGVNSFAAFKDLVGTANGLENQFGKVGELDVFSHAGKDGPNFQYGHNRGVEPPPYSNEQNPSGIQGLHVNWAPSAQAGFYGCNTANPYDDFAQRFANRQNVPTYGNNTSGSFSVYRDAPTIGNIAFRFGLEKTQNLYMVPQVRRDPQPKPKF